MKTILQIDNLKCGGCANSITKKLREISGVLNVEVNKEKESVCITHSENLDLNDVKDALYNMGYPEKGSVQGLEKLGREVKSYISCAIGKTTASSNQ